MTTSKETLEVGESPVSQGNSRPKAESGHLRSDAVSLDVPIKVHGSRVTEVVRGTTAHTEPFEEQTTTMIVFPQGGVLRMSTVVSMGQAMVLTNLKSRQDAICRVVKVRTNPNMHSYVEIEFNQPQPGYWGVYFPSDGPELAKKTAPAVPPAMSIPSAPTTPSVAQQTEVTVKEKTVLEAPAALEPVPHTSLTGPRDATAAVVESEKQIHPSEAPNKRTGFDRPTMTPAAPSPALSLAELRGDASAVSPKSSSGADVAEELEAGSQAIEGSSAGKESVTFGRFAASSSLGAPRAASREFGSRLEYGTLGATSPTAETHRGASRNWFLIAASVVVLFAAVGGGVFYFYARPAARLVISAPAAPQLPARTDAVENPVSAALPASESASQHASTPSPAPAVTVHTTEAAPSRPGKSVPSGNKPSASTKEKAPSAAPGVPDMFGALNAHPVSSARATEGPREAAPSIDPGMATGSETSALPAVAAPSVSLAPPAQPVPEGPVSVGGEVKPPKVISSVAPVYPTIARQANVEGNVVVRVTVDKTGNVSDAHAISGPPLLRQAAVDALRQRKYEPSTLNGQPISVEMLVTIQFHR
jgi:protein TonB